MLFLVSTRTLVRMLALLSAALFVFTSPAQLRAQTDLPDEAASDHVKLFEQGQNAHARGELQQAIAFYDAALRSNPELAEAEYQRGAALVSLKRYADAEKSFRRAVQLRPDWALPQIALGTLLARDLDAANQSQIAEAARVLERALSLDENNSAVRQALARVRQLDGKRDEGVRLLRQATESGTATADMWRQRAAAERQAGNRSEAAASLDQALALDKENLAALLERIALHLEIGEAGELAENTHAANKLLLAEKLFAANAARTAAEDKTRLAKLLANLHARVGEAMRRDDPISSLAHFRRAVELDSANVTYAAGYGAALVQAKRFAEAERLLRQVISVAPDNYAAHANLATALNELKRYDEALVEYRWLRAARPELAITDYFIAQAHDRLGQYGEALAAYEAFIARADAKLNNLEIERVNLRLPSLRNQAKRSGKR